MKRKMVDVAVDGIIWLAVIMIAIGLYHWLVSIIEFITDISSGGYDPTF